MGENGNRSFTDIIESNGSNGWRTFDMALINSYMQDLITEETAMTFSTSKSKVSQAIDHAKKSKGVDSAPTTAFKLRSHATPGAAPSEKMPPALAPAAGLAAL